ncbi:DUF2269 family protein [Roseobacteraceae bacterium NS-SX3]
MPGFYDLVKTLHILAAALMVGTTVANGLLHAAARQSEAAEAAALLRGVTAANRLVMGPSFVLLPATGLCLACSAGYGLSATWLAGSLALTALLVLAFLAGARLEHRLHHLARHAAATGSADLPPGYGRLFRQAAPIGAAALVMSLLTLFLMTAKPI